MEEILTITKKMVGSGGLVIIPRDRYEEYLQLKQAVRYIKPTLSEKKRIEASRREVQKGQTLTIKELRNALGY